MHVGQQQDKQIDILINMPKLKELYGLNLSDASKEKINLLRKSQIEKIKPTKFFKAKGSTTIIPRNENP